MTGRFTALREEAYAANLEIPRLGLAILTWGNASAYDPAAGVFAIKSSGLEYSDLTPESMVVVDLEGKVVEGKLRTPRPISSSTAPSRAYAASATATRPTPWPGPRRAGAFPASARPTLTKQPAKFPARP